MIENTLKRIADGDFFLIAGPCAIESEDVCLAVADRVSELANHFDIPYVFKSSFKKANRLKGESYCGPGLEPGLTVLRKVRERYNVPIITDIHETTEIAEVAKVADILQIPAFLCRQTDLVAQAGATGKWVNIKKGQFIAPEDMAPIAAKAKSDKVMLTERGVTFGYHTLVVDFRSLIIMKRTGHKVVFDATHSLQLPSTKDGVTLGQPEFVIPFARAAMAVGIDGLFVETHPRPSEAQSDAAAMLPLEQMERLLDEILTIKAAKPR